MMANTDYIYIIYGVNDCKPLHWWDFLGRWRMKRDALEHMNFVKKQLEKINVLSKQEKQDE